MMKAKLENALLQIALDLSASLPKGTQYQRLIVALNEVLPCDACALLAYHDGVLTPVAVDGLLPDVMQKTFPVDKHPRLEAILVSRKPVRFPADTDLPDPFDGLLLTDRHKKLDVHACMGCSLYVEDTLVGVLTLDSLDAEAFAEVENVTVATFAALAAATIRNATMIASLEKQSRHDRQIAAEMMREALTVNSQLLGNSEVMQRLRNEIQLVAASDLTVLITGETGTGKELVAKSIHQQSSRAGKPLIHVNCAALAESVAESELFGHVKGAFTGAVQNRAGKFELADGGTVFLDEIGELPLSLQAKLLRTLQQGELQRVGSDKNIKVNVRILAATNRNLEEEVQKGNFRQDLYHRLCVYPVKSPALAEHREDIPELARQFTNDAERKLGIHNIQIDDTAMQLLQGYDWPGNVRELEHLLLRASLKASQQKTNPVVIRVQDIDISGVDVKPADTASSLAGQAAMPAVQEFRPLKDMVDDYQRMLIREALKEQDGNWSQAANLLGVNRSNLHRLAKRLGILS